MRKIIAGFTVSTAMVAGGAASAVIFAPALSGAQAVQETPTAQSTDTDTDTQSTNTDTETAPAPANEELSPPPIGEGEEGDVAPVGDEPSKQERDARAKEHLLEVLQPRVDDGTINDEQANAVADTLVASGPQGPGRDGRGHGKHVFFHLGAEMAELLGITKQELHDAFEAGQSLAQIAEANGVERQTVVDFIVSKGNERIDQAVEDGRMTEEEAATKKSELSAKAEEMLDKTRDELAAERGNHPHRPGGPRGGEQRPDDATPPTTEG